MKYLVYIQKANILKAELSCFRSEILVESIYTKVQKYLPLLYIWYGLIRDSDTAPLLYTYSLNSSLSSTWESFQTFH